MPVICQFHYLCGPDIAGPNVGCDFTKARLLLVGENVGKILVGKSRKKIRIMSESHESSENLKELSTSWKMLKSARFSRLSILRALVNDPVMTKHLYIQTVDNCVIWVLYETQ